MQQTHVVPGSISLFQVRLRRSKRSGLAWRPVDAWLEDMEFKQVAVGNSSAGLHDVTAGAAYNTT